VTEEELREYVEMLRFYGTDVFEVEAKAAAGGLPKSIRETLSAFSNTRGGTLILGLSESDGFAAVELPEPGKLASDLASMCATELEPPVRALIQTHTYEGHALVTAEVPEMSRSEKPCYYKGSGMTKGSYLRVHDGDHRMTSYEVQVMVSGRGQPRDDEDVVPGTSVDDLDDTLVEQFAKRLRTNRPRVFGELKTSEVLTQTNLASETEDGLLLTVAGLAALGRNPQRYFPQLMLTFAHYQTSEGEDDETGERFVENVAIEGPIPMMVRDSLAAIKRNMSSRSMPTSYGAAQIWEYPETALREAIVNALVHRDLSSAARGTQVQVEMFPDRLAIRNPGGLFGPVSEDLLGEAGVSSSRNAVLLKALEDVRVPGEDRTVCENRGSGIRAMIGALRSAGMGLPEFKDRISSFTVTFPNHSLMSEEVVGWLSDLGEEGLTDSQCTALALMREGQELDNQKYREATRIDSRLATSELQDLVARDLAVQDGARRWATYKLHPRCLTNTSSSSPDDGQGTLDLSP
jgi:ATP-dependent DNA helicase RecG